MSFLVWCEIVCTSCSTTVCGEYCLGRIDRRGMKKGALGRAWKFINGDWYCYKCKLKQEVSR